MASTLIENLRLGRPFSIKKDETMTRDYYTTLMDLRSEFKQKRPRLARKIVSSSCRGKRALAQLSNNSPSTVDTIFSPN